jgi:hypothetical protein
MKDNKKISNGVKKVGTYFLYGVALFFAVSLIWTSVKPSAGEKTESNDSGTLKSSQKVEVQPAEKVQVYAFHSAKRCYSCVTMGQYTKETVEEFFQKELEEGKVEFKEINVDSPENKEMARKFKAVGSSLFINAIINGQDNIKEEVQVWRLLNNEKAFSNYLSTRIRETIGESAKG